MEAFFPNGWVHYLAGGLLLGAGMSLLFAATGLIGGMSTVFTSVWSFFSRAPYFREARFLSSRTWRLVYAAGLIGGALAWLLFTGEPFATGIEPWRLHAGGFIAGVGARLSNGCTAGHGICGIASLQPASILSVLVFLATAMITARVVAAFA
jgi:uncharacterized membrane protein YedE/YeeE